MFELLRKFAECHGLLLAHSVSSIHTGCTIIRALNPSPTAVMVYREEKVGLLHPVEETTPRNVHLVEPVAKPPSPPSSDPKCLGQALEQLEHGVHGLNLEEKAQFRALLQEFTDVITVGELGRTSLVKHTIDTGVAAPIRQHLRRLPFHQKEQVCEMLQGMLKDDNIEPATSPWSKKKDGSLPFCVDFCK